MDSGKLAIYILIGLVMLLNCVYTGIKKRRDKNFYQEPGLINLLSASAGTILLVYDFAGLWKFDVDRDSRLAVFLVGILVLLAIFVAFRNLLAGKKYTVHNIEKKNLEQILIKTLERYELEYEKEERHPQSMVNNIMLVQYDASLEITQRGGKGTTFDLVFKKFEHVYYFEDIILDIRNSVNESSEADRLRGIYEFAAAAAILLIAGWLSRLF